MQDLQHFDWRLLSLEDLGEEFLEVWNQALLVDEPVFLVQLACPPQITSLDFMKPISDCFNNISLFSDEENETSAKRMSKIGPELVNNHRFVATMVKNGNFPSCDFAGGKLALPILP